MTSRIFKKILGKSEEEEKDVPQIHLGKKQSGHRYDSVKKRWIFDDEDEEEEEDDMPPPTTFVKNV